MYMFILIFNYMKSGHTCTDLHIYLNFISLHIFHVYFNFQFFMLRLFVIIIIWPCNKTDYILFIEISI